MQTAESGVLPVRTCTAMSLHTAAEHQLVEALSLDERQQLAGLLRKLLLSVDHD